MGGGAARGWATSASSRRWRRPASSPTSSPEPRSALSSAVAIAAGHHGRRWRAGPRTDAEAHFRISRFQFRRHRLDQRPTALRPARDKTSATATSRICSTRFTAVATEIGTGHEHWLSRGRLVDAVRASYALPGIFKPVKVNGRWLFDGALVNPIPVSVCRALGARYVIAVNLNFDIWDAVASSRRPKAVYVDNDGELHPAAEDEKAGKKGGTRPPAAADIRPWRWSSRHLDRDGGRLQHRAGPHRALAPCRRSAGCNDLASTAGHRAVRFPSSRRSDRARCICRRAPAGRHGSRNRNSRCKTPARPARTGARSSRRSGDAYQPVAK